MKKLERVDNRSSKKNEKKIIEVDCFLDLPKSK